MKLVKFAANIVLGVVFESRKSSQEHHVSQSKGRPPWWQQHPGALQLSASWKSNVATLDVVASSIGSILQHQTQQHIVLASELP